MKTSIIIQSDGSISLQVRAENELEAQQLSMFTGPHTQFKNTFALVKDDRDMPYGGFAIVYQPTEEPF